MQIGRSASPAMKLTMTSCPMRGIWMPPSWLPAQGELTRTQQLLCWFFCPWRSQGNCTLMRPSSSVHRFWPSGPTTSATCGPTMAGLGWVGSGRNGSVTGWAVKSTCTRHCCLRSTVASRFWLSSATSSMSKWVSRIRYSALADSLGCFFSWKVHPGTMPRRLPLAWARAPWVRSACMRSRDSRRPWPWGSVPAAAPALGWA
ncbi:hypothetical protein D3C71_1264810 [compost metagenome]